MATVTNYNDKDMMKGYCSRCGAFFKFNYSELYSVSGIFNWGKEYLNCPGCGRQICFTENFEKNKKTGQSHWRFV